LLFDREGNFNDFFPLKNNAGEEVGKVKVEFEIIGEAKDSKDPADRIIGFTGSPHTLLEIVVLLPFLC